MPGGRASHLHASLCEPGGHRVGRVGGALLGGGDVIREVDGEPIRGPGDLAAAVAPGEIGQTLSLTVVSGGERDEVEVELDPPPEGA